MMYPNDIEKLEVGDEVGVGYTGYLSRSRRTVPVGNVCRITKTLVEVEFVFPDKTIKRKFNKSNGHEYGSGDSWTHRYLISGDDARAYNEQMRSNNKFQRLKEAVADGVDALEENSPANVALLEKLLDAIQRHK